MRCWRPRSGDYAWRTRREPARRESMEATRADPTESTRRAARPTVAAHRRAFSNVARVRTSPRGRLMRRRAGSARRRSGAPTSRPKREETPRHRTPRAPLHAPRDQPGLGLRHHHRDRRGLAVPRLDLDLYSRKVVGWATSTASRRRSASRPCRWRSPCAGRRRACITPTAAGSTPRRRIHGSARRSTERRAA